MKHILAILLLAATAQAETLLVFDATNGYDIASTRSEFVPCYLPARLNDPANPHVQAWRSYDIKNRPAPAALVDVETGISVPVTLATLSAATNTLAGLVDAALNDTAVSTDDGNKTWREMREQFRQAKDKWGTNHDSATNRIETMNYANTNQVRRLMQDFEAQHEAAQSEIRALRQMIDTQRSQKD